jgi:hypothetical protein
MTPLQTEATWRKSTYSGGEGGNCVELVGTLDAVRDSKNPDGPVLRVELGALLTAIKESAFEV